MILLFFVASVAHAWTSQTVINGAGPVLLDLDDDGFDDIVRTAAFGMQVYWNEGGTFALPAPLPYESGRPSTTGVAAADLDGDGTTDLCTLEGRDLYCRQGLGGRQWAPPRLVHSLPTPVTLGFRSIAVLEVNGDGAPDLLLNSQDGLFLFTNDGAAGFTVATLTTDRCDSLVVGDVDGDGDLDAIVTGIFQGDTHDLFRNTGGTLVHDSVVNSTDTSANAMLFDWDGDGDLDFVYDQDSGIHLEVQQNLGGGVFSAPVQSLTIGEPRCAGDFDDDGDDDLITTISDRISVTLTGPGPEVDLVSETIGPVGALRTACGDVDADGRPDLAWTNEHLFVLGDPYLSGGAPVMVDPGPGELGGVAAADLDGDGLSDIARGSGRRIALRFRTGATFTDAVTLGALPDAIDEVLLADLDDDGLVEIYAGTIADEVWRYENLGGGSFAAPVLVATSVVGALRAGDANSDGAPDLVGATVGGGITFTSPPFLSRTDLFPGVALHDIQVGDVDGDGTQDLVVAKHKTGFWLRGLGGGAFDAAVPVATTARGRIHAAAVLDHDGDGVMDLAFAREPYCPGYSCFGSSATLVVRGLGGGAFGAATVRGGSTPLAVIDVDGDGADELVANTQLLRRLGPAETLPIATPEWLQAVDMDDDGVLDLVVLANQEVGVLYGE